MVKRMSTGYFVSALPAVCLATPPALLARRPLVNVVQMFDSRESIYLLSELLAELLN